MNVNSLLYLMEGTAPQPKDGNHSFSKLLIHTGDPSRKDALYLSLKQDNRANANILLLSNPGQINLALDAFQKYQIWGETCQRLAYVEHDLNTLLEVCADLINSDIWIVSADYRMNAGSTKQFGNHIKINEQMPQSEIDYLYQENPHFDETFHLRGLQTYPMYWEENANLYYYNLFQEDLYLGRILFMVPNHKHECGILPILQLISDYVEGCYRFLYLRRNQQDPSFRLYELWRELLHGAELDSDTVKATLKIKQWNPDDEYRVLYLLPAGYVQSQNTLKYYAVQLESIFPCCIAAETDGALYCMHNLTVAQSPNFRQQFSEFLRENLFRAGLSNSFHNFFDSRRYRLQAEDAITFGQQKDPSLWRYNFYDYVMEYTRTQCTAQYPARDLCPRNLQFLMAYEEDHPGCELMETLYHYYACQFNAQLAAQKLFIHRTTFFYRMNKIQKIAAFHPEDPEETTQIMLAFQALRQPSKK